MGVKICEANFWKHRCTDEWMHGNDKDLKARARIKYGMIYNESQGINLYFGFFIFFIKE